MPAAALRGGRHFYFYETGRRKPSYQRGAWHWIAGRSRARRRCRRAFL